jgi:hypothetical protein
LKNQLKNPTDSEWNSLVVDKFNSQFQPSTQQPQSTTTTIGFDIKLDFYINLSANLKLDVDFAVAHPTAAAAEVMPPSPSSSAAPSDSTAFLSSSPRQPTSAMSAHEDNPLAMAMADFRAGRISGRGRISSFQSDDDGEEETNNNSNSNSNSNNAVPIQPRPKILDQNPQILINAAWMARCAYAGVSTRDDSAPASTEASATAAKAEMERIWMHDEHRQAHTMIESTVLTNAPTAVPFVLGRDESGIVFVAFAGFVVVLFCAFFFFFFFFFGYFSCTKFDFFVLFLFCRLSNELEAPHGNSDEGNPRA